jgi:short-subunit dehydrogenase
MTKFPGDKAMPNQLAVVTGASSGIGYELARVFIENGFDVVINSASGRLQEATRYLKDLGAKVIPIQADLASYDGVEQFWRGVEQLGRPVDAIAINAGVGVGGKFADTELDEEINLMRLNVEGTVHVAKRAVQHMVAHGKGRILITSSIAGEMVAPREAVYAASKAFDLSFAKSLREELEDTGVMVTALQPGPTDTDFFRRAGLGNTPVGQEGKKENSPYEVAKQGFEALMKGEKHVYSGNWKLKMEGAVASVTPDAVKSAMHEKAATPKNEKVA